MTTVIKDSGKREEFQTGSVRDTREGKGRFDLVPFAEIVDLALVYERGAVKYGDRNWEKGQPVSRFIDSAIRHLLKARLGYDDEPHWDMAVFNILGAKTMLRGIAGGDYSHELNDLNLPLLVPLSDYWK